MPDVFIDGELWYYTYCFNILIAIIIENNNYINFYKGLVEVNFHSHNLLFNKIFL